MALSQVPGLLGGKLHGCLRQGLKSFELLLFTSSRGDRGKVVGAGLGAHSIASTDLDLRQRVIDIGVARGFCRV